MKAQLQQLFLDHLIKKRMPCTVFLGNGVRLSGKITYHDEDALTLSRDGVTQLIFKHAGATVMPDDVFDMATVLPALTNTNKGE